jgi:hypothetical protein
VENGEAITGLPVQRQTIENHSAQNRVVELIMRIEQVQQQMTKRSCSWISGLAIGHTSLMMSRSL